MSQLKVVWAQSSLWVALFTGFLIVVPQSTCLSTVGKSIQEKREDKMGYPNYQRCSDSPSVSAEKVGIKTCFAGGKSRVFFSTDEPWLVFGVYRVGKDVIAEFGGEIDQNILVVVTHKETRAVYTGRVLKDDLPEKSVKDATEIGGEITSLESYFNLDLRKQCRMLGKPGKYWAIVLLGELASTVLEFEVK